MAQTKEGALKNAAARIGVTEDDYRMHVARGLKWCSNCKEWQSRLAFGVDKTRWDGLVPSCRESKNQAGRANYEPKPKTWSNGRSFVPARDGDQKQARRRVNYFVEAGLLPHPNTLPCRDCGHVWGEGERRHEYDHYRGYDAAHHEDVEPVCTECHHARERARSGASSLE